jgi:hypothetical protein
MDKVKKFTSAQSDIIYNLINDYLKTEYKSHLSTVKCDHLMAHATETSSAICSLDKSKQSLCPVVNVVARMYQNCILGTLSIGIEPTATPNCMSYRISQC